MSDTLRSLSTSGLAPKKQLQTWSDALTDLCGQFDVDPLEGSSFEGRINYTTVSQLKLCQIEASQHRIAHTVSGTKLSEHPYVKILFQTYGISHFEQGGRRIDIMPGDCLAYDVSCPHTIVSPSLTRHEVVIVPTVGGIAFALGAFVSILWWGPKNSTTLGVLLGGLIILGFGVWDDRANLGYRIKLLGQVAAALAVVIIGGIRFESIPFLLDAELPMWIGIPVTVFFVVAVSNAVNLTDGLDGLAGGLSFLTLCGIAYLAYLSNNSTVLLLTVPFLGGVLGFLRYNTYPARIFMGDGGSQLLGFIMGVLAILLTDSTSGPFSPALSLFLLGLPFLDTLGVAGQRLAEGRSPFIGDRKHVHHKLMMAGLSHYEAVTAIYAIQAGMVGLAYLLRWQSDTLIVPLYLILAGTVSGPLYRRRAWTDSHPGPAEGAGSFGQVAFGSSQSFLVARSADSILGRGGPSVSHCLGLSSCARTR